LRLGLLLIAILFQSIGISNSHREVDQLFISARRATDIRAERPFILEATVTAKGKKTIGGKYRMLFQSPTQWRQDVVIGSDFLTEIQDGDVLYTKSTSDDVEELLSPFLEMGNYPTLLVYDPNASWTIKERRKSGVSLTCAHGKSKDSESEHCFHDGLYVGDGDGPRFADFRDALGKRYPFSFQKTTESLSYAGNIERIAKASFDGRSFEHDASFAAEPSIVCESSHVTSARLINHVRPQYPPAAKWARVQGGVQLKARISQTGAVENLRILHGHPMLVQSAMDAVRQWQYEPTLCEGKPIPVTTTVNVNYSLSGSPILPR
jgi:TonB family protein